MKSPLRWAGSKRWQVSTIQHMIDQADLSGRRWVEPFAGGCNVALGVESSHALLNDANVALVNFWRHMQAGLDIDIDTQASVYNDHRHWFNRLVRSKDLDTQIAAQLFYYLNFRGFNGLWRVNASGEFNVPPRPPAPIERVWLDPHFLIPRGWLPREPRWTFSQGDYSGIELHEGDVVYADPPYDDGFSAYTIDGFSWADQKNLAVWLSVHDGPVIATNKFTPRVVRLYRSLGFLVEHVNAPQKMQFLTGKTGGVGEALIINRCLDNMLHPD